TIMNWAELAIAALGLVLAVRWYEVGGRATLSEALVRLVPLFLLGWAAFEGFGEVPGALGVRLLCDGFLCLGLLNLALIATWSLRRERAGMLLLRLARAPHQLLLIVAGTALLALSGLLITDTLSLSHP